MTTTNRRRRPAIAAERGETDRRRQDTLERLHQQLAEQVAALVDGDQWQAMLRAAARFHTYSTGNILLILAQRPDATRVAGYRTWQSLGRQVTRGERGIAILAPITYCAAVDDPGQPGDSDAAGVRRLAGFTVEHVWDPLSRESAILQVGQRHSTRVIGSSGRRLCRGSLASTCADWQRHANRGMTARPRAHGRPRRRCRAVGGLGTEAREAATERAVLRMVALGVPAAQATRIGYAGGWLGRLLSAFAE